MTQARTESISAEHATRDRYISAAHAPEAALCCPVEYDPRYLEVIPDVVVSDCVLNLVESGQKRRLFEETFRVLKLGGRAVISDIVSDELVPEAMQRDPRLWSGCISGALTEDAKPFDCEEMRLRHPRETKGEDYDITSDASQCCDGGASCC